jgi:alpha-tubulin suppressor-like RCC1 family protein
MTTLNLGNIRFNWRGGYDANTSYKPRDVVFYQGSSYVAVIDNMNTPITDASAWHLMAAGTDQLINEGDILTHDGNIPVRLSRGQNAQILQMNGNQPQWNDQGMHPSNRVAKLAKVNGQGGFYTRAYLMSDGTIKACGYGSNFSNGDPNAKHVYTPSRVVVRSADDVRFTDVFMGGQQNYALTQDGDVYSWGYNNYGQLGHGDTISRSEATKIDFFTDNNIKVIKVIADRPNYYDYGCALFLTDLGHLYGVGYNAKGELGNGTSTNQSIPVRCGALTDIVDVRLSGLQHSVYAIQNNGQLWVWGHNINGQLGLGDTTNRLTPIMHNTMNNVVKAIPSNGYKTDGTSPAGHGIILLDDGTIWTCGYNAYGQLGHGDTTSRTSFSQINSTENFVDIETGDGRYPTCASITDNGDVYIWGHNGYGQCGIGVTGNQLSPMKPTGDYQGSVTRVEIGGGASYEGVVLEADGRLWAAGYNNNGNLGVNSGSGTNTEFLSVLGLSGEILDWNIYGQGTASWGIGVLYTDGRVDACGANTSYGETGTHVGNLHNVFTLKNVLF